MMRIRRSGDRGHFDHGWLDTFHTFSFADYHDPVHVRFRALRVMNEDRVAPGSGFGTHPHRDMEIVTLVLSGALEHQDSMGNGSVIRPGELQRMTAGTGVTHSEANPSKSEPVHLYQIWLYPERKGLDPGYEQKVFPEAGRSGQWQLVASRDGRAGSLTVHQDADLYRAALAPGETLEHPTRPGRGLWLQVLSGAVTANGELLAAGDGLAVEDEATLTVRADADAEVLLFDLA